MGMNVRTCCHRCRVQAFHYRGEEQATILPFYLEHKYCMKINKKNLETLEDQIQWVWWMDEYEEINGK